MTKSKASTTPVRLSTGAASGDYGDGGIAKEEEEEGDDDDGVSGVGIARVISREDVPRGHVGEFLSLPPPPAFNSENE